MAGTRTTREHQYEQTKLTGVEKDRVIAELRRQGLSERAIATRLGVAPSNVHYILQRLAGNPRVQTHYEMCAGCGENVRAGGLNFDGLCAECVEADRR